MRRIFFFFLACIVLQSAGASDGVENFDKLLRDTRTWEADFVQTLKDERGRWVESAKGRVYLERPRRFRWDYQTPSPQAIVSDGAKLWVHDEALEQVVVRGLDEVLKDTPTLLLLHQGKVSEVFQLIDLGRRESLEWVELLPRAESASFERFALGFDAEQIRVMEMRDNFGYVTTLKFSDAERNRPIDDAIFRFSPPPGADVIEEK